ncbi:hypothetical protein ACWDR9_01570 [Streptosporangium sandarakinum]
MPQIRITGTTAVIDGRRVEGTTKGGRSRVVSIDGETAGFLRRHRGQQRADRGKVGGRVEGGR